MLSSKILPRSLILDEPLEAGIRVALVVLTSTEPQPGQQQSESIGNGHHQCSDLPHAPAKSAGSLTPPWIYKPGFASLGGTPFRQVEGSATRRLEGKGGC